MKVLYYVGTGSNKFGGLEKFNIQLFKKLVEDKHEVVVVYRRPIVEGPFKNFLDSNKIKYHSIFSTFNLENEGKIGCAQILAKIIKVEKPDVVHYNFGNLYDLALSRIYNPTLKYKTVYTSHCHPNLKSSYLKMVFRGISLFSDKILCVSQAIFDEFKNNLNSKNAETLYLGVPQNNADRMVSRRKYNFADDEVIICNIAYHDNVKGVDVLIRAINYLKNTLKASNFKLIQIGGAPFKQVSQELSKLLESTDIMGCFEFWGLRNDIEDILCASDIYCQSSRSEGIPLSMMEASMASLPIIATNVGGVGEVARENTNALLCKSEDYKALANNLFKLINSPSQRSSLGQHGREIALNEFEISSQSNRLCSIYSSL